MIIPGLHIDDASDAPVYRQIADAVRQAALDGRLAAGDRLPPTRDLARQLGVNRNTVVAAYDALAAEGWVRSHTGKGTFIGAPPAESADGEASALLGDPGTWFTAFSQTAEGAVAGGLQSIFRLAVGTSPDVVAFVGSYPAGELLPGERFARAMATALEEGGASVLTYGPTAGHPALRERIAEAMRRDGSVVDGDRVLITNGAQQGLELVFRTFVDRGDAVITEEPTYTGALSILGAIGARVVGVPVDEQGMRPDLLALALERHRPRLVYLQPTFQNPTTTVMPESRRREILSLLVRARCVALEDDWAGDLRLEGDALPTLHALDGGRHVIYLSTYSKKLMPGLRIGWLAVPGPVMDKIVELKRLQDCGTSPLLQAALEVFLRDGGLDEHLDRVRPVYRERRDCMLRALDRHFPAEASWSRPVGGLFVWVTLPSGIDGGQVFAAAQRRGVLFSRGDLFHTDNAGRATMRLTYSTVEPERIERGVALLGRVVRECAGDGTGAEPGMAADALPIF